MHVTRFGLKGVVFYVMLVCAFFAAPYLNLFFMLLAFCSTLAVLSIWWAHRNITGIEGQLDELEPVPAGHSQIACATLSCAARTRHGLSIEIETAASGAGLDAPNTATFAMRDSFDLEPGKENGVETLAPALPRGVHKITRVRVKSQFPFGLIEARRTLRAPAELVVYPTPTDLARFRDSSASGGQGLGGHDLTEMGPAGLREFKSGDEFRHVHWKATARRNELVVKELEGDAMPGFEVQLDLRATPPRLEESLSLLSAFALECKANKELFTLHSQDHRGTYGKGHQPFARLLTYLAGVQPLPANGPAPPAVSPAVMRLPLRGMRERMAEVQEAAP